ncbi:MAG: hypothetical protein WC760_03645 [Bacteroidia bacterium]|jgi:hypothetical protein
MSDNTWNGENNPRGASLTFTNTNGKAFTYYYCVIDFPTDYLDGGGQSPSFNFTGVSLIDYPGGMDYDTSTNYLAVERSLVYYQSNYYYCIQDTSGEFDPACWQDAGSNSYQISYDWQYTLGYWPGAGSPSSSSTTTIPVGLFTTDPGYNQDLGPIVSLQMTISNTYAIKGNPNSLRPPIINLPLRSSNGGTTGTPVYAIFLSATDPINYFILVCLNTGQPGTKNKLGGGQITGDIIYDFTTGSGGPPNPVAAVGAMRYQTSLPPITGITINEGTPYPFPNPVTSNPYVYTL